jgi:hypothetical protein
MSDGIDRIVIVYRPIGQLRLERLQIALELTHRRFNFAERDF